MLNSSRLKSLLSYNPETGILSRRGEDTQVGWKNEGYWRLSVDGIQIYACQVIWCMVTGEWPTSTIDHKDNNGFNDRWINLRLATKGQNAVNSAMNIRNTSGLKGASFCSTTGKWRASITISGKSKNLGRYLTAEEAHQAWRSAAIEAHGKEFVRA